MCGRKRLDSNHGTTTVEYALLIGMIGLLAMEAMQLTGVGVRGTMDNARAAMPGGASVGAIDRVS